MLTSLCQRSQKLAKTHVNPRKLYIMTWFVCSNMFECLKNVEIFQTPTSHPKTCCLRLSKKNSANVTFLLHSIWSIQKLMHKTLACNVVLMFLMALSKAMQTNSFLPQVQIESSACGEKPSNINLPNKFYVAKPG
jgi:hypothetical protein